MAKTAFLTRPLTENDLVSALKIEHSVHLEPWSEAQFKRLTQSPYQTLAVFYGDELCAYAIWFQLNADEAELFNIAVSANWQGQGLGRLLLAECVKGWREQGLQQIFLEVRESNQAAIGLYQALGFEAQGVRKNYYQTASGRENALMMVCTLSI